MVSKNTEDSQKIQFSPSLSTPPLSATSPLCSFHRIKHQPMKSVTLDPSSVSSATKTSSWPIIRGSLDDSITFESSISAVDSDSDHPVTLPRKNPLILRRTSTDSTSCEITIHFAHHHEIRQVYVRSTARVYEIYYAADSKGENQYLCTVRCGLAVQNEEPVQIRDAVASMPALCSGSKRCEEERHSRTESVSSTSEDGWVDVDPSGFDGGDRSLSNKIESFLEKGNQDLFEATAEISDADPAMSLTLRLLSIQSGDYIYVDEVYVYADPVISEDTDSSAKKPEGSSGNALMSMLVPTLLQLSKSRMSQNQPQNDYSATERRKNLDTEEKLTCSSSPVQSERMPSSDIHGASLNTYQSVVPVQTPDPQNRPYATIGENKSSFSHVEKTLDELVSRISRIEHFCLRFEDNMVKPISRMEARLEKVEQQLESFIKNPQLCRMNCTRISAPEFSCNVSEPNSTCINVKYDQGQTNPDIFKDDDCCHEGVPIRSTDTSSSAVAVQFSDMADLVMNDDFPSETSLSTNGFQPSDMPSTSSASHFHPSFVVTAPGFSSIDDEDENDMIEAGHDSPKDSTKKPLSIDDALASALSGLLSSVSIDPSKCTDKSEEIAELRTVIDSSPVAVSSVNCNGSIESVSVSHKEASLSEAQESLATDNSCEETTKAVRLGYLSEEEDGKKPVNSSVDTMVNLSKDNIEDSGSTIKLGSFEADNATNEALVPDDTSDALELPGGNFDPSFSKEVIKEDPDLLQNILGLPVPGTLDFEYSILDVKFSLVENSSAKSPLEALLVDMPESHNEILCIGDDNERAFIEPTDLLIVEDGDSTTCETSNNQFFFPSNYDSCCLPSNAEEEQQGRNNYSDQDVCASLI